MESDDAKQRESPANDAVYRDNQHSNGKLTSDWIDAAFKQHAQSLLRYCSLLTDRTSAEEIVQETFTRLCRECEIDDPAHLKRWLFTVCRNQAIDHNRKDGRMTISTLQESEIESRQPEPREQLAVSEEVASVMQQLGKLPTRQQEVVRLRFQAGLSYKEIAEVINSNVSNVGALLHQAIQTLRKRT